ncbi:MAG: 4Fe-4S dicluster domain-containing protein [Candidatus Tectomicrobia bacterium]|uniref:4Fe-4S dicluster domain-containing protein n=1 Tax=Tectimicrobiota bacterium TaxID=2528274 RepID=A0A938B0T6_UNCTE|nr:4Fe-4S dicluster domain-containing protein [Candidatus Tectomicrobia bacterium]
MIDPNMEFFLDPSRCIGCQACYQACAECETHRGISMIHLEYTDRSSSPQTVPVVCMHCDDPACAEVCPADAIKKTADGVVQSAQPSHCIGCSNCVLACPFGVPRYIEQLDLMMKCDMCYDRTSAGKRPMCVTVCPSGALAYGPREEIVAMRRERPMNTFILGPQVVRTKVQMMLPSGMDALEIDVAAFMTPEPETTPGSLPLPLLPS